MEQNRDLPFIILLASLTETLRDRVVLNQRFAKQLRETAISYLDEKDVSAGERISTLELVRDFASLVVHEDDE